MDPLTIRPETPADYPAIAEINARAFGTTEEALLVAALRHRPEHDPELSLVAEAGGQPQGHILLVPVIITLAGERIQGACLSPLAVLPEAQRRGIGSALVRRGHAVCRAKGLAVSMLVGHPGYYERFGYIPQLGGTAELTVARPGTPGPDLEERPVTAADLPLLRAWWERWEKANDAAIEPGRGLVDWLSYNQRVVAAVITRDGCPVAYARYCQDDPARILALLARDGKSLRATVTHLARRPARGELTVPVHPASAAARELEGMTAGRHLRPWPAFMLLPLLPTAAFERFRAEVLAGQRPIARAAWPPHYEVAGV